MATVVEGAFEWDSEKAAANVAKHGVSTDVSDRTRIISAWKAEPADRRAYINSQKV
jgi:uncharacterized DUF497 family protein